MKTALQLYTVRDAVKTGGDLLDVLKKVKDAGYEGVEFAGYFDLDASALKKALAETGLDVVSSHVQLEDIENRPDDLIAYAKALGCDTLTLAYSPANTPEEVERVVKALRGVRRKAIAEGIRILYHNHSHEFEPVGGALPIDKIREACLLEADTYWIFNAGRNPADYLRQHAAEIGLVHLKDGDLEGHPCAIGEGENDIRAILDACQDLGAQWVIVENDNPSPDGLSDIRRSRDFLRREMKI